MSTFRKTTNIKSQSVWCSPWQCLYYSKKEHNYTHFRMGSEPLSNVSIKIHLCPHKGNKAIFFMYINVYWYISFGKKYLSSSIRRVRTSLSIMLNSLSFLRSNLMPMNRTKQRKCFWFKADTLPMRKQYTGYNWLTF